MSHRDHGSPSRFLEIIHLFRYHSVQADGSQGNILSIRVTERSKEAQFLTLTSVQPDSNKTDRQIDRHHTNKCVEREQLVMVVYTY